MSSNNGVPIFFVIVIVLSFFACSIKQRKEAEFSSSYQKYLRICGCKESYEAEDLNGFPMQGYRCKGGYDTDVETFSLYVYPVLKKNDFYYSQLMCPTE